jgi:hypothetical protein
MFGSGICAESRPSAVPLSRPVGIRLFGKGWRMNSGLKADWGWFGLKSGFLTVVAGSNICPARTQLPVGAPFGPSSGTCWPPTVRQPPRVAEKSPARWAGVSTVARPGANWFCLRPS